MEAVNLAVGLAVIMKLLAEGRQQVVHAKNYYRSSKLTTPSCGPSPSGVREMSLQLCSPFSAAVVLAGVNRCASESLTPATTAASSGRSVFPTEASSHSTLTSNPIGPIRPAPRSGLHQRWLSAASEYYCPVRADPTRGLAVGYQIRIGWRCFGRL